MRFSNSISIHYHTLWIGYFILFAKVVKQLCVEAAFPACSSVTLSDQRLSENEATLRKIESGEAFESANREIFIAGSSAERVAIEPGWGHGWADLDVMDLYGGGMGVAVYHADQESPSLVFRQDLSPPAYCRIEVKNKDAVVRSIVKMRRRLTEKAARTCLKSYNGKTYLSSTAMVGINRGIAVKGADTSIESYREHAYTSSWTNDNIFSCDLIPCLVGSDPPMWAHGLFRRLLDGDWPSTETVRKILTYPSVFIMRGDSRYPRHDLMFRQISSVIEILFAKELPDKVRQAYCTFKTCFVRTLHQVISQFTHNFPLYSLKTILFHTMEESPPTHWENLSPMRLVLRLLHNLDLCLQEPCALPDFFKPTVNLFEQLSPQAMQDARNTVSIILSDPVSAIIKSPVVPHQIYGDYVSSEEITNVFNTSLQLGHGDNDLNNILQKLDSYRKNKWPTHHRDVIMTGTSPVLLKELVTNSQNRSWEEVRK